MGKISPFFSEFSKGIHRSVYKLDFIYLLDSASRFSIKNLIFLFTVTGSSGFIGLLFGIVGFIIHRSRYECG